MQRNRPLTAFIRQFHQEPVLYSWQGKERYRNIRIRQFAGQKNETAPLGKVLTSRIDHSGIAGDLVGKLKNEDIPDTRKLSRFSHRIADKFSSCIQDEPYMRAYYQQLLRVMDSFLFLVDNYRNNMQQPWLRTLTGYVKEQPNTEEARSMSSEETASMQRLLARYTEEMQHFYEDFNTLLRQGVDNYHPVKVASSVEYCLLRLMMLIERSIHNGAYLVARLKEWNVRLIRNELQELYN